MECEEWQVRIVEMQASVPFVRVVSRGCEWIGTSGLESFDIKTSDYFKVQFLM
jgi:hypothetical protein